MSANAARSEAASAAAMTSAGAVIDGEGRGGAAVIWGAARGAAAGFVGGFSRKRLIGASLNTSSAPISANHSKCFAASVALVTVGVWDMSQLDTCELMVKSYNRHEAENKCDEVLSERHSTGCYGI
jgi:hypothetical protein